MVLNKYVLITVIVIAYHTIFITTEMSAVAIVMRTIVVMAVGGCARDLAFFGEWLYGNLDGETVY